MKYNERSWGIDLISFLNSYLQNHHDSLVARVKGEIGLQAEGEGATLFPDIILEGRNGEILMGWELKFPDTDVEDIATKINAIEKANRLGTNSFIIWNVNEAALFIKSEDSTWAPAMRWRSDVTSSRSNVASSERSWQRLAISLINGITDFLNSGRIQETKLNVVLDTVYSEIIDSTTVAQTALVKSKAQSDSSFRAHLFKWAETNLPNIGGVDKPSNFDRVCQRRGRVSAADYVSKLIYAHELKSISQSAYRINSLNKDSSPADVLALFKELSSLPRAQAIFTENVFSELVSEKLFKDALALNDLLKELTSASGGNFDLSEALTDCMTSLRAEWFGQFDTPHLLARLLVSLTINDLRQPVFDPCSGTGTIPKEFLNTKIGYGLDPGEALKTIWASDKFIEPVSLTALNLNDPRITDTELNLFQADVSSLKPKLQIELADQGDDETRLLPKFEAICSNLPFIRSEKAKLSQDLDRLREFADLPDDVSPTKWDVYALIILGLRNLVLPNGRLGVIISNSWLGTSWGAQFIDLLLSHYDIEFLLTSGKGRWFSNANVVTTLLILRLRDDARPGEFTSYTVVGKIRRDILDWDEDYVDTLARGLMSGGQVPDLDFTTIPRGRLLMFLKRGFYLPSLVGTKNDLNIILYKTVKVSEYFVVSRGLRPGFEKFFFVDNSTKVHYSIEDGFLLPLFHRPAFSIDDPLDALTANNYLFSCNLSRDELKAGMNVGALRYIDAFSQTRFAERSRQGATPWYSVKSNRNGEFLLQINPQDRFGVYRPSSEGSAFSQRYLSLASVSPCLKREDGHAFLNSGISIFIQEATAFGKGLGALDRNSTRVRETWRIPDIRLISPDVLAELRELFVPVSARAPLPLREELCQPDRRKFDEAVLEALDLRIGVHSLYGMILDLYNDRTSVH